MVANEIAGRPHAEQSPCPGAVVSSPDHAERCRACGRCKILILAFATGGSTEARTDRSKLRHAVN